MPTPVVASDSIVLSPGLGYVDLPRTKKLLWDVYHWRTATSDRPAGLGGSAVRLDPPALFGGLRRVVGDARKAGDSTLAARADSVAAEGERGAAPEGSEF